MDEIENSKLSISELTDRIQKQLSRGQYICKICITKIPRIGTLWSCSSCYSIFHLKCIHAWIEKVSSTSPTSTIEADNVSAEYNQNSQSNSVRHSLRRNFRWNCPQCRAEYSQPTIPDDHCWCGRYLNPEPNPPGQVTHSCSQPCPRKSPYVTQNQSIPTHTCSHPCQLLCHPGPCPKCVVVNASLCQCGKNTRIVRCSESLNIWNCGQRCNQILNCNRHTCEEICHSGSCSKCNVHIQVKCLCGREIKETSCGTIEPPKCNNQCGQLLQCGYHKCEDVCHGLPTTCNRPCPKDSKVIDHCPCGKTKLTECQRNERRQCNDPIPTCNNKCQKLFLICGHYCQKLCHDGSCGQCLEPISKVCRCGSEVTTKSCWEWTNSDDSIDLKCNRICNQRKSCKRHKCQEICCPAYQLGSDADYHFCLLVCNKPLSCGKHNCDAFCHVGRCPPCCVFIRPPIICSCGFTVMTEPLMCGTNPPECPTICGKIIPSCGHTCSAKCHYDECKCLALVDRSCAGGHRVFNNVRCWVDSSTVFCRSRCGKLLEPCKTHSCTRLCHTGDCGPCNQLCGRLREFCTHYCQSTCHHEAPICPDVPCTVKTEITCSCGFIKKSGVQCGAYSEMRVMDTLPCDLTCDKEKRRKQLEEAFGDTERPEEPQVSYDNELVYWARRNQPLVKEIDCLAEKAVRGAPTEATYTPTLRYENLIWIDYYLQLYWRLETRPSKDANDLKSHLIIHKDRIATKIPQPKLSQLHFDAIPNFSGSPRPAHGFVRSNVILYGFDSYLISCEEVQNDRTINQIACRLSGLKDHWRLRWTSSFIRSSGKSNRYRDTNETKPLQLVPSNFRMLRPHLIIEAIDEHLGMKILDILIHSRLFFGNATPIGHPIQTKSPSRSRLSSEDGHQDDGWTTVGRKNR